MKTYYTKNIKEKQMINHIFLIRMSQESVVVSRFILTDHQNDHNSTIEMED